MISKNMKEQLVALGLKRQQAESTTAEAIVDCLMSDEGKMLIQEAKNQVDEMQRLVWNAQGEYEKLMKKINEVAGTISDIEKAQKEFGTITDKKAIDTIVTFASLIDISVRKGANDIDAAISNAGYVTYAYLGGQAKRDIKYDKTENNKIQLGWRTDDE